MTLDIDFDAWLSLIGCLIAMIILSEAWLRFRKDYDREEESMEHYDAEYSEGLEDGEVMVSYYGGEVRGRLDVVSYPNISVVTIYPTYITLQATDGQINVIQSDTIVEYCMKGVVLAHV